MNKNLIINNNTTINTQNININVPKLNNLKRKIWMPYRSYIIYGSSLLRELLANHCDPNYPENQNVRIKSIKEIPWKYSG
jgi:hypothetical protein